MLNGGIQPDAEARGSSAPPLSAGRGRRLGELARVFLKLGATAFGGPAAHIALLEQEVVQRRRWLTHGEFLDLLGMTHLIPGPNSTEMAIHIGLRQGGWRGLLVAGACFIGPALAITLACAWSYVRYAELPQVQGILYGIKPVVLAIVVQALWRLGRTAFRKPLAIAAGLASFAACLAGIHELLILLVTGAVAPLMAGWAARRSSIGAALAPLGLAFTPPASATSSTSSLGAAATSSTSSLGAAATSSSIGAAATVITASAPVLGAMAPAVSLWPIFLFFAKVGAVLYGSGYVLLAFLRGDLVERWGWLGEGQLLDAIAIGQVTPGPLFSTATFIGYLLAGTPGAAVATLGIFLPAFAFVAISAPLIPRLRRSHRTAAFLDGVNGASLALMAAATLELLTNAFVDPLTVILGLAAAALLLSTRLGPIPLILTAGAAGWLAQ